MWTGLKQGCSTTALLLRENTTCSCFFKATSEFGSSKKTPLLLYKTTDSSSKSNSRLGATTGTDVAILMHFLLPRLCGGTAALLQELSGAGTDSDRFSTCPTSTTSDVGIPVQKEGSPTSDDSPLRKPNHLSDVSRASFRRTTAILWAFLRSTTAASYPSCKNCSEISYADSSRKVPAAVTADVGKLSPLTLKQSSWVNLGNRKKLCTQAIVDAIDQWLKLNPSNFTLNVGKSPTESRRNRVVNWNSLNE